MKESSAIAPLIEEAPTIFAPRVTPSPPNAQYADTAESISASTSSYVAFNDVRLTPLRNKRLLPKSVIELIRISVMQFTYSSQLLLVHTTRKGFHALRMVDLSTASYGYRVSVYTHHQSELPRKYITIMSNDIITFTVPDTYKKRQISFDLNIPKVDTQNTAYTRWSTLTCSNPSSVLGLIFAVRK